MSGTGVTGVGLGGPIKPLGGAQAHVFEDVDGWGGFRVVADATERNAIFTDCQKLGMWIFQVDTLTVYRLTAIGSPPSVTAVTFGASAPSGTGFVKAASSAFSVVAAIDLSSDTGSSTLPVARLSGLTAAINAAIAAYTTLTASQVADFNTAVSARIAATAPTGTGFSHYVSGTRDAAAKLVDLASDIVTSSVLPAANGGGQVVQFPTFTTTTAALVTIATSRTIPTGGSADVIASVSAHDSAGAMYRVDLSGSYKNVAGTVTAVSGPAPSGEVTDLLGVSATLSIVGTTIALIASPKVATIVWVEPYFSAAVG